MSFLNKMSTTVDEKVAAPNPFAVANPLLKKVDNSGAPKKKLIMPKKIEEITEEVKETKMAPKKLAIKEEIKPSNEKTVDSKPIIKEEVEEEISKEEHYQENVIDTDATESKEVNEETEEHSEEEVSAIEDAIAESNLGRDEKEVQAEMEEIIEEIKTEQISLVPEEKVKEKPKSKSVKSKGKASSKVKEKTVETEVKDPTLMTYKDAVDVLKSNYHDEGWEEFKEEVSNELGAIVVQDDMNPSTLKMAISELSRLRQKIWLPYQEAKTNYDALSREKPEGLIERIKRTAFDETCRNDMDRRKAGIEACMSYIPPNSTDIINLYDLLDATTEQYTFLKAVMDSIQYKTNILITMNGAIKLEAQMLPGEV